MVERLAVVFQGSLLLRHSSTAVADAFCATRLGGDGAARRMALAAGLDLDSILDRARVG